MHCQVLICKAILTYTCNLALLMSNALYGLADTSRYINPFSRRTRCIKSSAKQKIINIFDFHLVVWNSLLNRRRRGNGATLWPQSGTIPSATPVQQRIPHHKMEVKYIYYFLLCGGFYTSCASGEWIDVSACVCEAVQCVAHQQSEITCIR